MKNIKIVISYDGTNYAGWQKQNNARTIQEELEYAIKSGLNVKDVSLTGSGRTDAGVHALRQVANFQVDTSIPTNKIPEILNNKLPKDIVVLEAIEVDEKFHSRFSAHRKRYMYQIYPSRNRSPFLKNYSYQIKYELDFEKMKSEINCFLGEHDFEAFKSQGSSVKTSVREIYDVQLYKKDDLIIFEIEGNGFLYNMVRIIVGTLVDIGRGHIQESIDEIIKSKDRNKAGHTAPPQGLFLKKVDY